MFLKKSSLSCVFSFVIIVVSAVGCSGEGEPPVPPEKPLDAWGYASDPLPEGFEEITPEEFLTLEGDGQLRVVSPEILAEDDKSEEQRAAEDEAEINTFVDEMAKQYPDLPSSFVERMKGTVTEVPGEVEDSGDGNYEVTFAEAIAPELQKRILFGKRAKNRMLAESIRRWKKKENHLDAIQLVYAALPPDQKAELLTDYDLPAENELASLSLEQLLALYPKISDATNSFVAVLTRPAGLPPEGYPASCKDEVGYPANAPQAGELAMAELNPNCGKFNPDGIYSNFHWPLKWYATCVKDQGKRGSCAAFATVAAVEMMAAKKYGKWTNLSEQDLYFEIKNRWWPQLYGDGTPGSEFWAKMLADQYKIPLEYYWPYNPAYNRLKSDTKQTYHYSCSYFSSWSYADKNATPPTKPYCSDTAGQGRGVCAEFGGYKFCGFASPVGPHSGYFSGYRATSATEMWNSLAPQFGLDLARLHLAAGYPVILAFDVPATFTKAPSFGTTKYYETKGVVHPNPDLPTSGAHAALLTGFIRNEDLAAKLPDFPPGEGGGYFIVKNSWSTCWGDAGYGYLSYDWVAKYGFSLIGLKEIQ